MTPEFHHWHHSNEEEAIWCNYSTFLPLWDLVFGTYYMPKDKRPTVYGVDEAVPMTMMEQLRYPLEGMGNPLRFIRHPWRSFKGMMVGLWGIVRMMKRSAFRPRGQPFHRAVLHVQGEGHSLDDLG